METPINALVSAGWIKGETISSFFFLFSPNNTSSHLLNAHTTSRKGKEGKAGPEYSVIWKTHQQDYLRAADKSMNVTLLHGLKDGDKNEWLWFISN